MVLKEDNNALDEVVVVGYGTQKKATLTGAVEQIGSQVLESRAITNVGAALQGATPGLVVTRSSSRPGNEGLNFQIRGLTSVNGGSPLIIVDGVPVLNSESFQNLNSDDIENISVLKDGSASIYGAKAANGVILVTTKKVKARQRLIMASICVSLPMVLWLSLPVCRNMLPCGWKPIKKCRNMTGGAGEKKT